MFAVTFKNYCESIKNLNDQNYKTIVAKSINCRFFFCIYNWCTNSPYLQKYTRYFIAASFGSSMVLLFGFPESPFAQPKNVFFGHLVTALVGVIFVNYIPLPIYISIAIAVGAGVFLMILFNIVHPPAGGNPIIVIIGSASYDYLINPIIFGCIIILLLAIIINKYLLKKNYPLK